MTTMHDLADIRRKALSLMEDLGRLHLNRSLQDLGWTLQFNRAKVRLGVCRWKRHGTLMKVIALSRHYATAAGWAVMEDVVRHEIAHALDFETRGKSDHGPVWKGWARKVGADPTRLYEGPDLPFPTSKYVGICPVCGAERPFYRRVSRSYACPSCCKRRNGGRYAEAFRLRILERSTGSEVRPRARPLRMPKYTATCPNCLRQRVYYRRLKHKRACGVCCEKYAGGRYDERFRFVIERIS